MNSCIALMRGLSRSGVFVTARLCMAILVVWELLGPAPVRSEGAPIMFRAAERGTKIVLPEDHGAHPDYETEWWYYTGHLVPVEADLFSSPERYGFQLTFFRRAHTQNSGEPVQVYLAHAALTDVQRGAFFSDSRLAVDVLGIAGAAQHRLDVRHLDWSAEQIGPFHHLRFALPSLAPSHEIRLIGKEPPLLLHGENGFSRKGRCESCASMYYSLPRIEVTGHIVTPEGVRQVHGAAWMDHEYMTNALQPDQEGWDWISLLFKDGTDLMIFRIRSTGTTPPVLAGTIRREGRTTTLGASDILLEPIGERWRSAATGADYPVRFRVEVPRFNVKTEIESLVKDQEVKGHGEKAISYYEGAIRTKTGDGIGYLEMTGYAQPLGKAF